MTPTPTAIRIPDLSEAARRELAEEFSADLIRFENEDGDSHDPSSRELATATAIVTVSIAALRVLAVWIARHTSREETEITIQTQQPNGAVQTIVFRSNSATVQSEAGVLKQLAAACKVDAEAADTEAAE